jgi:Ca2+-binding RTX toxin-like protein
MALGDITEIGTSVIGNLTTADIAYLDDGSYIVAYSTINSADNDIAIERYSADGSLLYGPIEVGSPDPIQKYIPIITVLENNTFSISYIGSGSDTRTWVYNDDLTPAFNEFHIADVGTVVNFTKNVTTHALDDGGYIAFWYENWSDASNTYLSLMSERIDASGNVTDGPAQNYTFLASGSTGFNTDVAPQVVNNDDGTVRVFIQVDTSTPTYNIRSINVDPDNISSGTMIVFNYSTGANTIDAMQVLQNDQDEYFMVWEENDLTLFSASDSAAGLGATTFTTLLEHGEAAIAPDGRMKVLGWDDQGGTYDLVIKTYDFLNGVITTLDTQTVATGYATATNGPQLSIADNGDITAQWYDDAGDPYLRTFSEDAVPTGLPEIVGFRTAYSTLSVDMSGVIDPYGIDEGTLQYTWLVNGLPAGYADGDEFYTDFGMIGQEVSVLVSYESDAGYQEFLLSDGTAPITEFYSLPDMAEVSGRMVIGETLEADITELQETNFAYQLIWFVDGGVAQVGGTTFDLTAGMIGQDVDLLVNIEDADYQNGGDLNFIVDIADGMLVDYDGVSLSGSSAEDILNGSAGEDNINGMGGNDTLSGGSDSDKLYGLGGDDDLYGGLDGDILSGSSGLDELFGGSGNDQLIGGSDADYLDGGDGIDMIKFTAGQGAIYVDLEAGEGYAGEADGDIYIGIENVIGTSEGDVIVGNAEANLLKGGNGQDQIFGGEGSDRIYGEAGADILVAGADGDRLFGGNGTDVIVGGTGRDVMFGGTDQDMFYFGDDVTVPSGINQGDAAPSTGFDRVGDFENGVDLIVIDDAVSNSFGDITINAVGNNSIVEYENGRIIMVGTATGGVTDLDATDFMFL